MYEVPKIVRERMKAARAGDHPDPDLLTAFAEQTLSKAESGSLLEHLARCGDCRDVLALATLPSSSPHMKDTVGSRKAPWFSWPVLQWGAAAACVVVVGTAVLLHRESQPRADLATERVASAPAVASSSPANEAISSGDKVQTSVAQFDEQSREVVASKSRFVTRKDGVGANAVALPAATPVATIPPPTTARTKDLRDERRNGPAATGAGIGGGLAPAPTAPEPPRNQLQNLPANGRNMDYLQQTVPPTAQAVEVQAQAEAVSTNAEDKVVTLTPGRAKTAPASPANVLAIAPNDGLPAEQTAGASMAAARTRKERAAFPHSELRWNVSSDGQLQRSTDSGKTWQPVAVAEKATFRALAFNGPDIWVGGAEGLLYHSTDAGGHWVQVKPAMSGSTLTADIAGIAFTDPQHGKITTSNGETWTTEDAGQSWHN
jgi:hypothetical protein